VRRERESTLAVIREHLGHIAYSMGRIQTLAGELEASLGITLPEFTPHPLPDLPRGRPDVSA
jgi:hypothetical protein